jgi:hypothetical protein
MTRENQLGETSVTDESLFEFAPENISEPLAGIPDEAPDTVSFDDLSPADTETVSVHQTGDAELEPQIRPGESDEVNVTIDVEPPGNSTASRPDSED